MHKYLKLLLLLIFIALIIIAIIHFRNEINPQAIQNTVNQFGLLAPIIFILLYALVTIFFLPGSIFTIAGGVIFGLGFGTLYSLIGSTIGATLAFIIARFFAHDIVREKSGPKLNILLQGVEEEGWRFIAFVRLVPLIPFNLLNYALGLTPIRLSAYIIASFIFMLPGCFIFTYFGYAGAALASGEKNYWQLGLIGIAVVAALIFLPRFVKKYHARLKAGRQH